MPSDLAVYLAPLISAAFAAGGAYMAVRVELRWLRHDIDSLAERVKRVEQRVS